MNRIRLTGWRFAAMVTVFVGAVGGTMYSVFVYPLQNIDYYKARQAENRAGIVQEDVQPGNMRVWSDPFARKT